MARKVVQISEITGMEDDVRGHLVHETGIDSMAGYWRLATASLRPRTDRLTASPGNARRDRIVFPTPIQRAQ
jgi:hypothetical protein